MKKLSLPFLVSFLSFLFVLSSCNKLECTDCENDIDPTKTNLRIKNISSYDFEAITVKSGLQDKDYGNVHEGEASCYHNFDKAYDYAYIKMMIDGEEFILQPIDYVGEDELGPGKFSYSVDVVNFAERRLSISVSPD